MRRCVVESVLCAAAFAAQAQSAAIAPKCLYSVTEENPGVKCVPEKVVRVEKGVVTVAGSDAQYPCFDLVPTGGSWDLSPWGHVETEVCNTSDGPISINMRVDQTEPFQSNTEIAYLKPGEKRTLKVIFGYQYGYKAGPKLDPSKIKLVKLFLGGKSDKMRTFTFTDVMANGPAGEKPPVNPNNVVTVPENGRLVPFNGGSEKNFNCWVDSKAVFAKDGTIRISFSDKKGCAVRFKPEAGSWNLGEWTRVDLAVSNTCSRPIVPIVKVDSKGGAIMAKSDASIMPGKMKIFSLPFAPEKPWDANEPDGATGTKFESHRVTGLIFQCEDNKAGDSYMVVAAKARLVPATTPKWLGKRPPVPGKWKMTFADEFDGKELDRKTWVTKWPNYWDKRTHFSDDNAFLRDGKLVLRYEKKKGRHNDEPDGKETDYQCGYTSTFGTFTQLYGYFEARMKLPRAPGLWPAFWTMPDRGGDGPHWKRSDTWNGGMEFDIMEHLTAWGPHRFNMAFHWDGYEKGHKSKGTSGGYLAPDKEGFITVGMLWEPGGVTYFGNGEIIGHWKHERIANVPMYFIFYMVSGGWANVPLEDGALPDEFQIDYFRAWQRHD